LCEQAVMVAERAGALKYQAVALRARGRMHVGMAHYPEAERDLKQALDLCEMLDLPWERGQTLTSLGLFYRARAEASDTDDQLAREEREADLGLARRAFEQALGFFESLKAAQDAERVRSALTELDALLTPS
jgi:tetratricopeptide (TPR) repeat protein